MRQYSKKDLIIDAAQKRFSHFGVGKTTMNEIADDLSISKASLYYYFPDKLNLFAAVLQKIIEQVDDANLLKEENTLLSLFNYLDHRTDFIIQHYNILEYLKVIGTTVPKELEPVFSAGRNKEVASITRIIAKGVEAGSIKSDNPAEIAELLLDCLDGLRLSVGSHKINFFPDKQQFLSTLVREKEVAKIFIKGLSC